MADESDRTVHCGNCGRLLDEPAGMPIEKRTPCPDCHDISRQFRITLGGTVSAAGGIESGQAFGDVTIHAPAATVHLEAPSPEVVISGEFKVTLTWSKTPGGMWLALVHNEGGAIVGVAVQEDSQDVLLVLEEELRPPE